MAENIEIVRGLAGIEDLYSLASVATTTVTILDDTGEEVGGYVLTPVNTASLYVSSTMVTTLGLSAGAKIDAALTAIAAGSGFQYATTAVNGQVYRMSAAPAVVGQPIAIEQNDARIGYIPTSSQSAGINAAVNALTSSNPAWTLTDDQLQRVQFIGSGKDGAGQLGAISSSSTAPVIASSSVTGLLTGTFTWKIAAYNLSGSIVASSASASSGAIVSKQVTLTLPALLSAAMGWYIYRSTDGVNWYHVGTSVGSATSFTDNNNVPNTASSAPGSDTTGTSATLSGEFHFTTLTVAVGQTITVGNSGNHAGWLVIRCTGVADISGTITGLSAHRTMFDRKRMGQVTAASATGTTGVTESAGTFLPTTAASVSAVQPLGFGVAYRNAHSLLQGFGSKGFSFGDGVGGAGGYPGATIIIRAYQFASNTLSGTVTTPGGNGSNGTAGTGTYQAFGGGGAAGGTADAGALIPWKLTGTLTAPGGNGGNTLCTGGASTMYGGPGAGGGYAIARNCYDTSGGTFSAAAGTAGTNSTTDGTGSPGTASVSGAHAGNGSIQKVTQDSTAGQAITFKTPFDPRGWDI